MKQPLPPDPWRPGQSRLPLPVPQSIFLCFWTMAAISAFSRCCSSPPVARLPAAYALPGDQTCQLHSWPDSRQGSLQNILTIHPSISSIAAETCVIEPGAACVPDRLPGFPGRVMPGTHTAPVSSWYFATVVFHFSCMEYRRGLASESVSDFVG